MKSLQRDLSSKFKIFGMNKEKSLLNVNVILIMMFIHKINVNNFVTDVGKYFILIVIGLKGTKYIFSVHFVLSGTVYLTKKFIVYFLQDIFNHFILISYQIP